MFALPFSQQLQTFRNMNQEPLCRQVLTIGHKVLDTEMQPAHRRTSLSQKMVEWGRKRTHGRPVRAKYLSKSMTLSWDNDEPWMNRSEELGSDSVYIDGMGQINQRHCDVKARLRAGKCTVSWCVWLCSETINEKNNCVYYVAVKGVSPSVTLWVHFGGILEYHWFME